MTSLKKLIVCASALSLAFSLSARPGPGPGGFGGPRGGFGGGPRGGYHHRHHGSHRAGTVFGIGAGILGATLIWFAPRFWGAALG